MASNERPLCGRVAEQGVLRQAVASGKSEFVALYGRRRVGKTFLVRRFFADQPVVYLEVVGRFEGSVGDHMKIFASALGETFHRGATLAAPAGWQEAFAALRSAIESHRRGRKRKFVVFLDELPWLASHRSGCLSALEHFWNAWCSRRDDIVLVVCGSAASWMRRRIVNAKGGLHNRLTRTIPLQPFTLAETQDFFDSSGQELSLQSLVELFMVFGGVPHYLEQVPRGRSVAQVVDELCLGRHAPLADEFDRLFASLFDDDAKYVAVVRALAKKRRGLTRTQLLEAMGAPSGGGPTTILENLEQGGFIEATVPFGRTSRDRIYRLIDEFSLFHLNWLTGRRPSSWQNVRKGQRWQAWAGLAFESLCLRHADAIKRALGIAGVETTTSAWLHEEAQVDMLIDRADDVVSLCEMKFTDAPFRITKKYAEDMRRKVAVFRAATGTRKNIHVVFVTSYGLVDNAYARDLVDAQVTMDALVG